VVVGVEDDMTSVRYVAILLVCAGTAGAGDAVSDINGRIGYLGGSMAEDPGHNAFGSFSVPVAQNFGFQADGLYTHVSDRDFYGGGGHLFWRDWDTGLLGVTGGTVQSHFVDSSLGGVEGEYYWGRLTFTAGLGAAHIGYNASVPFIATSVTDFYATAGLRYYLLDDLMFGATYLHLFDNELGVGQIEYQTPLPGLSLLAEAAVGSHGYDHVLLGAQLYLGTNKSLIRRHREDDPPSIVRQILDGIGVYGAEYNQRGREYAASHQTQYTDDYGLIVTNWSYGSSGSMVSSGPTGQTAP
jgi:hypothetical protein